MKRLAVIIIAIYSLFGVTKIDAQVGVGVNITVAPPELPVYEQPPCPTDGYMWCPGYWAWGPDGYYWVPGVWVASPQVGFLWTPGYWGFVGGAYLWHGGYWGPHVGFYGGVCYGWGYGGHGFWGGRWEGGRFAYNTAICHVNNTVIRNTYVDRTVINNSSNHTSFNGRGGIEAQPTAEERTAMNEHHIQPTSSQMSHERSASTNRNQLASVNHGNPRTTAKASVGGQKFNSSGHAMQSAHPANNASHMNAGNQQHNAMQNRGGMQRNNMQRSGAQPQRNNMQNRRQSAPMRAAPAGGGRMGGGARGNEHR